jgi:hypothetical protein
VAEGGGLLNRCRGSTPTVSSNLIPSANLLPCRLQGAVASRPDAADRRRVIRRVTRPEADRKLAVIEARDDRLVDGFHGYQPADRLRWRNGDAALPAEAFAGFGQDALLGVHLGGGTTYPLLNEEARRVAA